MRDLLADAEQDFRDNARTSLPQLLSRLKRLRPALGSVRAVGFSSDHVQRYRSARRDDGATRASINRELEILQRAWNLALQCDPPKVNRPFYFPMYEENNIRTGFLEDEGYAGLHSALPSYLKPLLLIGYHVPCRKGEGSLVVVAQELLLRSISLRSVLGPSGGPFNLTLDGPL
jgi:hypothetical protein